jgi:hypothetical protein
MKGHIFKCFLIIGLIIRGISGIGSHYSLISDFGKGFLDGIAIVFIVFGLVFSGITLGIAIRKMKRSLV